MYNIFAEFYDVQTLSSEYAQLVREINLSLLVIDMAKDNGWAERNMLGIVSAISEMREIEEELI